MSEIDDLLKDRGGEYGNFLEQAKCSQRIKHMFNLSINWQALADDQREWLEMLAVKLSRILTGNMSNLDSYRDIIGYTQLVLNRLEGK